MLFITIPLVALLTHFLDPFSTHAIPSPTGPAHGPLVAISGNNTYIVWANNDTGHFNVFFAKSTDGGRTPKTMTLSAPNKGNTINYNTEISASGNHVYVTWWTNKTGILMPVFRASNDNGIAFGKTVTLNSTVVPAAVPKLK
jgi:hypothetical protein